MPDSSTLPVVAERMADRGFAGPAIEKVMGLNWLRVIRTIVGR